MIRTIIVLLGLYATSARSQQLVLLHDPRLQLGSDDPALVIEAFADYNANTVYNELPLALRSGGYLSPELRRRTADQLNHDRNTLGYVLQARMEWQGRACARGVQGWAPLIAVAHHDVAGTRFTKDQYALAFFGNGAYEGKTATLAPSAFEQLRFQTIGAGLKHARSGSFVRVDLVRGQSLAALDVTWASLYTGEDGRVIRSAVLGTYHASDTSGSSWDRTNGTGASVSARWNYRLPRTNRPWTLGLGVDELGAVVWNNNSVHIAKDTVISYRGWRADNVFALDDVVVNEDAALDTFGLRYTYGEVTRWLPFRAYAYVQTTWNENWFAGVSVEHRHLPGFVPQASALVSRSLGSRTALGATLSYGGFGVSRIGLSARQRFGKSLLLTLDTPHLPGWFLGRARGLGLMFGINLVL